MASMPTISWQIDREKVQTVTDFLGLQSHCGQWLQTWNENKLATGSKAMINLDSILKSRDITLLTKSV